MDLHDQHFLVIRTIEDADPPSFRQCPHAAPQKRVVQLFAGRLLEAVDLAPLRIDARHDVLDRAVLAGRIHGLKDQQDGPGIRGIEQLLRLGQRGDVLGEKLFRQALPIRLGNALIASPGRVVVLELDALARIDTAPIEDFFFGFHARLISPRARAAGARDRGRDWAWASERRPPCARRPAVAEAGGPSAASAPRD